VKEVIDCLMALVRSRAAKLKAFLIFKHEIDRHYREELITIIGNLSGSSIFGACIDVALRNNFTEMSQVLFSISLFLYALGVLLRKNGDKNDA